MSTSAIAVPGAARKPANAWQFWGRMLVLPYLLVFVIFVLYPVGYGLWLARHPRAMSSSSTTRSSSARPINTLCLRGRGGEPEDGHRAGPVGLLRADRWWIKASGAAVHPALGRAVDPDHPVGSLHAESGVGRHQHDLSSTLTGLDGPNWLNDPTAGAELFDADAHLEVTAVLDPDPAGRSSGDPAEQYEAASVDGATRWQKFRFITWPAMKQPVTSPRPSCR
jgi:multiple sugar transport system permease protein